MFNNQLTSFMLVPTPYLESLVQNQQEIISLLKKGTYSNPDTGDYIDEKQAMKMMGRKATWFWQMRKAGKLAFSKVGKKVFYDRQQILGLIKSSEGNS